MTRLLLFLAAAFLAAVTVSLAGCGGEKPETEVVSDATLTQTDVVPRPRAQPAVVLSGTIRNRNAGPLLALDLATLERLPLVRYRVQDPWVKREVVYTGVLLSDLLELARVPREATELRLTALDDYTATIALADVARWPVLLATRSDGKRMSVAEGGPTRIVFPYGQYEIDHGRYDPQWIWSVETIAVR